MTPTARLYVGAVIAFGTLALGLGVLTVPHDRIMRVVLLCALQALVGRAVRHGKKAETQLTLGTVIGLGALFLTGPSGAMVVAAADLLVQSPRRAVTKRLFNTAETVLATGFAGLVMVATGGTTHGLIFTFPAALVPAIAADLAIFTATAILVGGIVAITSGLRPVAVARGIIEESLLLELGCGIIGLGLAVAWEPARIGPMSVALIVAPLWAARWTYAQWAGWIEVKDRTIQALVQAVETKDYYTRGHSERVARASVMIARELRMPEIRIPSLRTAGILHDVGKLGVATRILQKTGRLTDEEFFAVMQHPTRGDMILEGIDFLQEARIGILYHHERIDGLGYPEGLKGDAIPEIARIISVADAFDSMTSNRSYRNARSVEEAVAELRRCSGTQFETRNVEALVASLEQTPWASTAPDEIKRPTGLAAN